MDSCKGRSLPTRYKLAAWFVALAGLALLIICPVRSTLIRLGIVTASVIVFGGLLLLIWRRVVLRWAIIGSSVLLIAFIFWPAQTRIDEKRLRGMYVENLRSYDGTRYVYGGETHIGIDCSGLVRAGMIEALSTYAAKTLDAAALRASFGLWWRDSNAIDLGRGRTGDTSSIGDGNFTELSSRGDILAGDLAVTESGSHVLVYLGEGKWIEAEPTIGRTHIFSLSGEFASLARERVRFVRWRWLASANPSAQ